MKQLNSGQQQRCVLSSVHSKNLLFFFRKCRRVRHQRGSTIVVSLHGLCQIFCCDYSADAKHIKSGLTSMNYDAKLLHQKFGNLNQGHWGEVSPEWITISSQDTVPTVQNFTKRNLALQHVIFMNFVCWKIHGPWQWDSPWQVRSLNPAPLVQDLMAPTWRDPCLSCAYFVMVLAHPHFSRLAATYLSITCTTHHDILWLVGGTPMTTWITDYWGTLTVIDSPKTCGPEQEPIKVSEREIPLRPSEVLSDSTT